MDKKSLKVKILLNLFGTYKLLRDVGLKHTTSTSSFKIFETYAVGIKWYSSIPTFGKSYWKIMFESEVNYVNFIASPNEGECSFSRFLIREEIMRHTHAQNGV